MPFVLTSPIKANKISFSLASFKVDNKGQQLDAQLAWELDDGTKIPFSYNVSNYDEDGAFTGRFDQLYKMENNINFTSIYTLIASELGLDGTIDKTGELE